MAWLALKVPGCVVMVPGGTEGDVPSVVTFSFTMMTRRPGLLSCEGLWLGWLLGDADGVADGEREGDDEGLRGIALQPFLVDFTSTCMLTMEIEEKVVKQG